jgi:hypothetical protein
MRHIIASLSRSVILPPKLHNYTEFVPYLKNRFDIDGIVNDDRHLVRECNNDELLSHHCIPDIDQWYYEKVMAMHPLLPILDHVSLMLRLAQCACHLHDDDYYGKILLSQHTQKKLAQLLNMTEVIQLMTKDESGLQMKTSSFTISLFEEFETPSPLALISMIMYNHMNIVAIGVRYNQYPLP